MTGIEARLVGELPDSAIEAAARADFEDGALPTDAPTWGALGEEVRESYRAVHRVSLAAALPFLERATRADKPYSDAPETTPWLRFVEKPTRAAYNLGTKLRAARVARGGEATE